MRIVFFKPAITNSHYVFLYQVVIICDRERISAQKAALNHKFIYQLTLPSRYN